jgi:hypothetical protein
MQKAADQAFRVLDGEENTVPCTRARFFESLRQVTSPFACGRGSLALQSLCSRGRYNSDRTIASAAGGAGKGLMAR